MGEDVQCRPDLSGRLRVSAAGAEDEFVAHCKRLFAKRYPDINGPDYTSIIDQRSYDRLPPTLEDARAKGRGLVNLAEGQMPDAKRRSSRRISS